MKTIIICIGHFTTTEKNDPVTIQSDGNIKPFMMFLLASVVQEQHFHSLFTQNGHNRWIFGHQNSARCDGNLLKNGPKYKFLAKIPHFYHFQVKVSTFEDNKSVRKFIFCDRFGQMSCEYVALELLKPIETCYKLQYYRQCQM